MDFLGDDDNGLRCLSDNFKNGENVRKDRNRLLGKRNASVLKMEHLSKRIPSVMIG